MKIDEEIEGKKRKKNPYNSDVDARKRQKAEETGRVFLRTDDLDCISKLPDVKQSVSNHLGYFGMGFGFKESGFLSTFEKNGTGVKSATEATLEYSAGRKYIHTIFIPPGTNTFELEQKKECEREIVEDIPREHRQSRIFKIYGTNKLNPPAIVNAETGKATQYATRLTKEYLLKGDFPGGTKVITEESNGIKDELIKIGSFMSGRNKSRRGGAHFMDMAKNIKDSDLKESAILNHLQDHLKTSDGASDEFNKVMELAQSTYRIVYRTKEIKKAKEEISKEIGGHSIQKESSWEDYLKEIYKDTKKLDDKTRGQYPRKTLLKWKIMFAKAAFPNQWQKLEYGITPKTAFNILHLSQASYEDIKQNQELWKKGYSVKPKKYKPRKTIQSGITKEKKMRSR